jgi:hypothetical protein
VTELVLLDSCSIFESINSLKLNSLLEQNDLKEQSTLKQVATHAMVLSSDIYLSSGKLLVLTNLTSFAAVATKFIMHLSFINVELTYELNLNKKAICF